MPSDGKHVAQLNLGKISDDFSKRVLKDTGIDISNMDRVLDTQGLRHVWNKHGPFSKQGKNNEPVSIEAVSIYKDAVENFDRIDVRKKKNADTITFEKDINGTIVVVEEVRTGKGQLAFKTMWIEKRK